MTNQRILLESVSSVRRLLAASEHTEVARVGRLGEITYLVEEHVTQAEVDILDALIAESAKDRRIFTRRLQERRDALEPYVGKNLLKTGMQCESRQFEIYVDPGTERIVHLDGFYLADAASEEPEHASPSDRARWIFANPRDYRDDGQRVVELLLAGRDVSELSSEELLLLSKGYNWWGKHTKSFETAKLGLTREPDRSEWLSLAGQDARNAFLQDLPRFLTACDACITEEVGPPAFWHLMKADQFISIATGECELEDFEWSPGDPILHPELLRSAAKALEAALVAEPELREQAEARGWVGDWNGRFAAVLRESAFKHLTHVPRRE